MRIRDINRLTACSVENPEKSIELDTEKNNFILITCIFRQYYGKYRYSHNVSQNKQNHRKMKNEKTSKYAQNAK